MADKDIPPIEAYGRTIAESEIEELVSDQRGGRIKVAIKEPESGKLKRPQK